MPYAEIVFSQPQQLAVLGHAIQDYRFLKTAQHLEIDAQYFTEAPLAGKIWETLLAFAEKYRRCPSVAELEGTEMFVKEEERAIASHQKWLSSALEASRTIGKDTIGPLLAEWAVSWTMRKGVEDAMRSWNNGDLDSARSRFVDMVSAMRKVELDAIAKSSSEWYDESIVRQDQMPKRLLKTGLTWIDDPTCGLRPDDLMVVTSPTGFGKTQLMTMVALNLARAGRHVKFFALEAGDAEIELRIRFAEMLAIRGENTGNYTHVDYVAWSRGLMPELKKFEPNAAIIKKILSNVNITYKKTSKYGIEQLERDITAVSSEVDAIIIDHLHYIDKGSKKNETEALSDIVHRVRDVNLGIDRTIIMAAHVKKNQEAKRFHTLLPSIDDVYGSGDISKTATWVLALSQTAHLEEEKFEADRLRKLKLGAPTLARFLKSRDGGGSRTGYTLVPFFRRGTYDPKYTIGRSEKADTKFVPLLKPSMPTWAINGFPVEVDPPASGTIVAPAA
jgi:hypothetical protein